MINIKTYASGAIFRFSEYLRLSLLCSCLTPLFFSSVLAGSINTLELREGKLTVSASQISLVELAQELAHLSGITFLTTGESVRLVDVDIVDEPLAKAIAKISPNHLLVSKVVNEINVIFEVIFMLQDDYNDSGNFQENLPSGEPVQEFIEPAESNYTEQVVPVEMTDSSTSDQSQTTAPNISQ